MPERYTHEVLAYVDARRTPKTVPGPRRGPEDCSLPSVVAHAVPRVRVSRRKPPDAEPDVPPVGGRRGSALRPSGRPDPSGR